MHRRTFVTSVLSAAIAYRLPAGQSPVRRSVLLPLTLPFKVNG
jgi:hypothetical protein